MLKEILTLFELYFTHSFIKGLSEKIKPLMRMHVLVLLGDAIDKVQLHKMALKAT